MTQEQKELISVVVITLLCIAIVVVSVFYTVQLEEVSNRCINIGE